MLHILLQILDTMDGGAELIERGSRSYCMLPLMVYGQIKDQIRSYCMIILLYWSGPTKRDGGQCAA